MIQTKPGVRINGLQPEMSIALCAVMKACAESHRNWWITSIRDGKHSDKSLHYVGFAIDLDTESPSDFQDIDLVEIELRKLLTEEFDVVAHKDGNLFLSFHIEFQPKLSDDGVIEA